MPRASLGFARVLVGPMVEDAPRRCSPRKKMHTPLTSPPGAPPRLSACAEASSPCRAIPT
eukprot:8147353-Pyramimonas_sp.AAC.1